jgi:hypothetical protein
MRPEVLRLAGLAAILALAVTLCLSSFTAAAEGRSRCHGFELSPTESVYFISVKMRCRRARRVVRVWGDLRDGPCITGRGCDAGGFTCRSTDEGYDASGGSELVRCARKHQSMRFEYSVEF